MIGRASQSSANRDIEIGNMGLMATLMNTCTRSGTCKAAWMIRRFTIVLVYSACLCGNDVVGSEREAFIGSVPLTIHGLMKERGCFPIPEFYAREVYRPPFVVNHSISLTAFVCQIGIPKDDYQYKLVVGHSRRVANGMEFRPLKECPSEILFRGMPGGLAISVHSRRSSQNYNLMDDAKKESHPKQGVSLKSSWSIDLHANPNREAEHGYFCRGGQWHHVPYH